MVVPIACTEYEGQRIKVGVGIHDSSAALLPYLRAEPEPFLLISTGTWSISLNPFSGNALSRDDLEHHCLNFLRMGGEPVRAARLFFGKEYSTQVSRLAAHYRKESRYHRQLEFGPDIYRRLQARPGKYFHFEHLPARPDQPERSRLKGFSSFEEAHIHH